MKTRHQERFRQRWELENQQRLEKLLQASEGELRKQWHRTTLATSFLVYLNYKGSRLLLEAVAGLLSRPQDLDGRLEAAEQQRLNLRSQPGIWLK